MSSTRLVSALLIVTLSYPAKTSVAQCNDTCLGVLRAGDMLTQGKMNGNSINVYVSTEAKGAPEPWMDASWVSNHLDPANAAWSACGGVVITGGATPPSIELYLWNETGGSDWPFGDEVFGSISPWGTGVYSSRSILLNCRS